MKTCYTNKNCNAIAPNLRPGKQFFLQSMRENKAQHRLPQIPNES